MISVLICTHNPNPSFFNEVLLALKQQDLPYSQWEMVIVDNASKLPVSEQYDCSWHPNIRFVVEPNLGVAHARYRACLEARGNWFIYVDDDNVLANDYLSKSLQIIDARPYMGCFGGNQIGRFIEKEPSESIKPYLSLIAVRNVSSIRISNMYDWVTTPAGAGMVIRAEIVNEYVRQVHENPIRKKLGRKGESLMSSEDIDIAYTSIDLGYMNGLFPELKLIHIIPERRLSPAYLIKLKFFNIYSTCILDYIRFRYKPRLISYKRFLLTQVLILLKGNLFLFKMRNAHRRAIRLFLEEVKQNKFE